MSNLLYKLSVIRKGGEDMNRSHRLLSIYTRLMNRQYINKQQLAHDMSVDKRTIQRDIDDIRSYLYDSEEYGGQRIDVEYNHQNESYQLSDHKAQKDSTPFRAILIMIRSHTPVLHKQIYDVLQELIEKEYGHDRKVLQELLRRFVIKDTQLPFHNMNLVIQSIINLDYLHLSDASLEVEPLDIVHDLSKYYLRYRHQNKLSLEDLSEIQIEKSKLDSMSSPLNDIGITLEIEKNLWLNLREHYELITLDTIQDHHVVATFQMTMNDAFSVCLEYSPNIRLVGPASIKEMFHKKLLELSEVYFSQKIKIDR